MFYFTCNHGISTSLKLFSRIGLSRQIESKTDVTPAIFSRNFVARVFSRDKIASVTWRVARVFKSRATLFPNRALLYSVQLC